MKIDAIQGITSLIKHAEKELKLAGLFDEDSDYGGMLGEATMDLIKLFSDQGHSGNSAAIVSNLFNKLSRFETIVPLTLEDGEWNDTGDNYQNKRNSAVFKDGKYGRPYYIDAYYLKNQKGHSYYGSLPIGACRCYIKDVSDMPKICIDIIDWETKPGWWESKMKDPSQLEELKKHYDVEIIE